ncbi:FadR/GntR family transcriptional regulator [Propionibacteriaceae bacterium Y1685]|uniref:FadR/GntR family transcriptional regulator n=1 Tax=Microlunatus sp. Y1700 TaxID=3418487 RepID=UPI003B786F64
MSHQTKDETDSALVRSQTAVVVDAVKELISSGALGPGDRLPIEKELAAEFGVSRGSLREAIRALAVIGILETRQGAGTFVTDLSPAPLLEPMSFWVALQAGRDVHDVHVVRRALEVEAAGTAAQFWDGDLTAEAGSVLSDAAAAIEQRDHTGAMEADRAFHAVIARASRNPVLAALTETMSAPTQRARLWVSVHEAGRLDATHREHLAILAALGTGDSFRARTAMATHLYGVEGHLEQD